VAVSGQSAMAATGKILLSAHIIDATGTTLGVNLTKRGDVVATFDTTRGGWSELWIDEHDAKPQT